MPVMHPFLVLSPELANLIWPISKIIISPTAMNRRRCNRSLSLIFYCRLCAARPVLNCHEVYPEIRSYLLMLLTDGRVVQQLQDQERRENRVTELARFPEQYMALKLPETKYDGGAFRQLNDWAVKAWLKAVGHRYCQIICP